MKAEVRHITQFGETKDYYQAEVNLMDADYEKLHALCEAEEMHLDFFGEEPVNDRYEISANVSASTANYPTKAAFIKDLRGLIKAL